MLIPQNTQDHGCRGGGVEGATQRSPCFFLLVVLNLLPLDLTFLAQDDNSESSGEKKAEVQKIKMKLRKWQGQGSLVSFL